VIPAASAARSVTTIAFIGTSVHLVLDCHIRQPATVRGPRRAPARAMYAPLPVLGSPA